MGLRTIEQELQAERQMRIAVEREYSKLKEKYDILYKQMSYLRHML
jgi:hypothetical protein